MAKYLAGPAAAIDAVATAIDALGRAARVRSSIVGSSIAALVPATWDGVGKVPIGWCTPFGVLTESGGARVVIVATDDFARGKAQFAAAEDTLPGDWAPANKQAAENQQVSR